MGFAKKTLNGALGTCFLVGVITPGGEPIVCVLRVKRSREEEFRRKMKGEGFCPAHYGEVLVASIGKSFSTEARNAFEERYRVALPKDIIW